MIKADKNHIFLILIFAIYCKKNQKYETDRSRERMIKSKNNNNHVLGHILTNEIRIFKL